MAHYTLHHVRIRFPDNATSILDFIKDLRNRNVNIKIQIKIDIR